VAPNQNEVAALTQRAGDPLIARVAARLVDKERDGGEKAEVARLALRELYAACQQP
jgi:hypothetical protein